MVKITIQWQKWRQIWQTWQYNDKSGNSMAITWQQSGKMATNMAMIPDCGSCFPATIFNSHEVLVNCHQNHHCHHHHCQHQNRHCHDQNPHNHAYHQS